MDILPIFYSHDSYKSLFTYSVGKDVIADGPRSIVKLAKDNNLTKIIGVSNTFASFIEAYKNLKKENIQFIFGLEMWLCDDIMGKGDVSLQSEHKIIILIKNNQGYKDLIKIYSAMKTDKNCFYYKFRFDLNKLKTLWTDNLMILLPFFDSFVARNTTIYGANIVPDFPCIPVLAREQNCQHPHEITINAGLDEYNKDGKCEELKTKTVFYEKREDMVPYATYRCMKNRTTLEKPELDQFCSSAFSFEDYLKLSAI